VITGVSKIVINIEDLDANDRAVGVGRDSDMAVSSLDESLGNPGRLRSRFRWPHV
jgi:hypothetical protein